MTLSPPKCKICGTPHYYAEGHIWPKTGPVAQRTEPPTSNRVAAGSTPAGTAKSVTRGTKPPVTPATGGNAGNTGNARNAKKQRAYRERKKSAATP